MSGEIEVPQAEREKLFAERAKAEAQGFGNGAQAPEKIPPGPPPAPPAPTLQQLTPEQLKAMGDQWPGMTEKETAYLLRGILSATLRWRGLAPLTDDEVKRGGEVWTPVMNKWAPFLLKNYAAEIVAAIWIFEIVDARRILTPEEKKKEAEKLRARVLQLENEVKGDDEVARLRKRVAELEKEKAA